MAVPSRVASCTRRPYGELIVGVGVYLKRTQPTNTHKIALGFGVVTPQCPSCRQGIRVLLPEQPLQIHHARTLLRSRTPRSPRSRDCWA